MLGLLWENSDAFVGYSRIELKHGFYLVILAHFGIPSFINGNATNQGGIVYGIWLIKGSLSYKFGDVILGYKLVVGYEK